MTGHNTVIVTGAAGNLGRAVVSTLAARGARLVCVDRTAAALDALTARLSPDIEVLPLPGVDLNDPAAAAAMVEAAVRRFGGVSALVNTVGGFTMGGVVDKALGQWDAMMTANARIALVVSAAVLPAMQAAHYGRIVHIAAAPGLRAGADLAARLIAFLVSPDLAVVTGGAIPATGLL